MSLQRHLLFIASALIEACVVRWPLGLLAALAICGFWRHAVKFERLKARRTASRISRILDRVI